MTSGPQIETGFQIAPSILSSDFCQLAGQAETLAKAGCQVLHLDIMDGHFVPNLTIGPPFVKNLAGHTELAFDVHLMVTAPDEWTEAFDVPNTRCITVHAEAGYHIHRSLQAVRARGKMAGISLNPATPLGILEYLWDDLDLVLLMTVNPGFGAQKYIPACTDKIRRLRQLIDQHTDGRVVLEIDGGVNRQNLEELAEAGAQWIVTGNALFSQPDLADGFRDFQSAGAAVFKAGRPS